MISKNDINLLLPYNPWWDNIEGFYKSYPDFHRPTFNDLWKDMNELSQIISITGPRRIGKSTLMHQLIGKLLQKKISPNQIIYYSFDDPALLRTNIDSGEWFDHFLIQFRYSEKTTYLFLDEIQKLERWELYLKKAYDLKFNVKIVVSGSAISPIFKKSRESLLGRIKDHHLLPFSFFEYLLHEYKDNEKISNDITDIWTLGQVIKDLYSVGTKKHSITNSVIPKHTWKAFPDLEKKLVSYLHEGGFPEVWSMPEWSQKIEYLYDNHIKKVIYEDLVLATEFRKPEILKRFYISLLESPGSESSVSEMSEKTGIAILQIEKYLPLLEITDLIYSVGKFRKSPIKVRRGKVKFYLVDLSLRNAVLRIKKEDILNDPTRLGLYAENLVYLALKKWNQVIQIDYYREENKEIDFIVHKGANDFIPIEVKYRNNIDFKDLKMLKQFAKKYSIGTFPILITKQLHDYGTDDGILRIPLPIFLIMFGV